MSRTYNIPWLTSREKFQLNQKLLANKEKCLGQWIISSEKSGLPITKDQLLDSLDCSLRI